MAVDIHKRSDLANVLWIAVPSAFGMIVMTIQSLVDMFWIGRLGTESVAAVAISGNIINVIFGLSGFLHTGTVALVSRAVGAKDKKEASQVVAHAFIMGGAVGIFLLIFCWISAPWMIRYFDAEPEVTNQAITYLQVMSIHLMLAFFLIPLAAVFYSSGDTVTPLILHSIAVILNSVLDPIFIFTPDKAFHILSFEFHPGVLGWGVYGAGMATNIAVFAALIFYFIIIPLGKFPVKIPKPSQFNLDFSEFNRLVRIGLPSALAMLFRPLSTILILKIIADFGSGPVAGFGIALRLYSINFIFFGGLGAAASVLVGQYLGAKSKDGAGRISKRLIAAGIILQLLLTAMYVFYAEPLIGLFDSNMETIRPGADFMVWVVLGFIISSPGGLAAAAMNGAGDTKPGMIAGFVSNWIFKLPLAWILSGPVGLGLLGIWIAMFISLVVEGGMCLGWYGMGKWKNKSVAKDAF